MRFVESMPCLYETYKDLSDRLDGTICRYEGNVVFVRVSMADDDEERPVVYLYDWPQTDKMIKEIEPNDPAFDISLIDLGYMNYICGNKNVVLYPYRSSSKKYKQGTSTGNCFTKNIDGTPSDYGSHSMQSQGFVDMVNRKYPPLAALELHKELALSRDVAVRVDSLGVREFYWRLMKIAVQVPGQKIHRLDTEFSSLVDKILRPFL